MSDDGSTRTRSGGSATPDATARARALLDRGYGLQLAGDGDRAATCFRESIAVAPSALGHVLLGWSLANGGLIDAAIGECLEALRIDPAFGNAWTDIGAYLIEKGDPERARAYLEGALELTHFERHHYSHANLGRAYRKQGLVMKALDEYRRALALEPRNSEAKKAIREIQRSFN